MSRWHRVLLAYTLVVGLCGVAAAFADGGTGPSDPSTPGRADAGSVQAVPTTTVPSLFPPLVSGFGVRAVRTPAGFTLPVLGGTFGAWEVRTPCADTAVVTGLPVRRVHVVLDPGHGGSEPGAVGPSGLIEADLNLDIAQRAKTMLEAEGATVVLTRPGDVRVTLATRGEIARSLAPLAFVSIHHNAAPLGRSPTPGSEVYHHLADPASRRLAGLLWEEYQEHLTPFGTDWAVGDDPGARARRSTRTGDDFYGVLRNSQGVPGVLSEAAFLSDPAENALLGTDEFRDAEARAIADAIVRLVASDDPGSGFVPVKDASSPAGGGGGSAGCIDPPLG